jgi:hypothetical protein
MPQSLADPMNVMGVLGIISPLQGLEIFSGRCSQLFTLGCHILRFQRGGELAASEISSC